MNTFFYGILIFIQLLGQDSLVGVIVKGHLSTEETKLVKKSSATDRPTLQPKMRNLHKYGPALDRHPCFVSKTGVIVRGCPSYLFSRR